MFGLRSIVAGLRALFQRRQVEQDTDEELRAYLDAAAQEKMRSGMTHEQALRGARLEMGSLDAVKEQVRAAGWEAALENLWQDVGYALRQFKRSPGFTAVVVITLALGIGANSAVFSVLNGLFLRQLPIPEPGRVVMFSTSLSWQDYRAYRDQAKSFDGLSVTFGLPFTANLSSARPPQHIFGTFVTGNFLATLGVKPALGRGFLPDEDQASSPKPVVILSYKLWHSQFGGDPAMLGRTIRLNNADYTVVGVMPREFRALVLGVTPDIWAPMAALPELGGALNSQAHPFTNSHDRSFMVLGRLKRGVSRQEAQAEVNVIHSRLHPPAGKSERGFVQLETAGVLPGSLGKEFLGLSSVVLLMAGLVLLVACVNIANLLLARGASRRREMAIRLAIGAGRGRVIRQLMVGNLILAFSGAAVGLLLACAATNALATVRLPLPIPITLDFSPDVRILVATAVVAVLTSLLFGFAPALRSTRLDLNASLKDGDATASAARPARGGLIAVQVAVSVVVLVTAALFLHSLWNGFAINLGFRPENLLVVKVDPFTQGYSKERTALFLQELEKQVERLPGIRSASVVAPLPLSMVNIGNYVSVPGTSRKAGAGRYFVGAHYFETMGIPLLRGRDFRDVAASAPPVAVISRLLANSLFPGENPVGQQVAGGFGKQATVYQVIGVVGDTKSKTIGEEMRPCLYALGAQRPGDLEAVSLFGGINLIIKTTAYPKALAPLEHFHLLCSVFGAKKEALAIGGGNRVKGGLGRPQQFVFGARSVAP